MGKPDTSLEARQNALERAHGMLVQSRDSVEAAMRTLSELSHAATAEEHDRVKAELAAAREAAGKQD